MHLSNLKHIIEESVRRILSEKVSSRVFHFLPVAAMANISRTDTMMMSPSSRQSDAYLSKGFPYYLSLSRTPSTTAGYVRMRLNTASDAWRYCIARIEFDGELLNKYYVGNAVNYFNDALADPSKIKRDNLIYSIPSANSENPTDIYAKSISQPEVRRRGRPNMAKIAADKENLRQIQRNQMHEYEDRIFSDEPQIEDVNTFIRRIDILLCPAFKNARKETQKTLYSYIGEVLNAYGDKVNIYDNEVAFNSMNVERAVQNGQSSNPERYSPLNKENFIKQHKNNLFGGNSGEITFGQSETLMISKLLYCAAFLKSYYTGDNITREFQRYVRLGGFDEDICNMGAEKLKQDIAAYGRRAIDILSNTALKPLEYRFLVGPKRAYFNWLCEILSSILETAKSLTQDETMRTDAAYSLCQVAKIITKQQKTAAE